jgi:hypothetical protein
MVPDSSPLLQCLALPNPPINTFRADVATRSRSRRFESPTPGRYWWCDEVIPTSSQPNRSGILRPTNAPFATCNPLKLHTNREAEARTKRAVYRENRWIEVRYLELGTVTLVLSRRSNPVSGHELPIEDFVRSSTRQRQIAGQLPAVPP